MITTKNTTSFAEYAHDAYVRVLDALQHGLDTELGRNALANAQDKLTIADMEASAYSEVEKYTVAHTRELVLALQQHSRCLTVRSKTDRHTPLSPEN